MSELTPNAGQTGNPDAVVDGFMYNPRLLYAPGRYLPLALEGLMPYRNWKYAQRLYTAPVDPTVAIPAGDTQDFQLRIVEGSVIVGARFCTLGTGGGAAPNPNQILYLIRDSNTQKNFADGKSRYINCNSLVPNNASGAAFCIFAKPYQVGGGVVVVSLTNTSAATDIKCQLVLYVMEPAQLDTNEASGSVMLAQPVVRRRV